MTADINDNDSFLDEQVVPDESIDENDVEGSSEAMETRTLIYLRGQFKGDSDEALVDKVERTSTDQEGLQETTEIRYKTASGCGHVLHTASEAGLACLSCRRLGSKEPEVLCVECAKSPENICYLCNAPTCYRCRRERRFIDGEDRVVCKACVRSTLLLKFLKQLIKWLLIGAGIYYLFVY